MRCSEIIIETMTALDADIKGSLGYATSRQIIALFDDVSENDKRLVNETKQAVWAESKQHGTEQQRHEDYAEKAAVMLWNKYRKMINH